MVGSTKVSHRTQPPRLVGKSDSTDASGDKEQMAENATKGGDGEKKNMSRRVAIERKNTSRRRRNLARVAMENKIKFVVERS